MLLKRIKDHANTNEGKKKISMRSENDNKRLKILTFREKREEINRMTCRYPFILSPGQYQLSSV